MTKTYDNEMKIEFLSKSKNEAFARIAVAAFIAQLDPTVEEVADIKTAVSEAVTNAIIHGFRKRNRKYRRSQTTIVYYKIKFRKIWNGIYNNGKLYG